MQIVPTPQRPHKKWAAPNELSDFTRRVPTFRTRKQEEYESKVAARLVRLWDEEHNPKALIDYFAKEAPRLCNPTYWELMRTVWVAAGSTETAPLFRRLMSSSRPARSWFMTVEDAKFLADMPDTFRVWRAVNPKYALYEDDEIDDWCGIPEEQTNLTDEDDPGISWTIDLDWCRKYALSTHRIIKAKTVRKCDVFAYVSRRGESEMIIL